MDPRLAALLIAARNSYAYPWARVIGSSRPGAIPVAIDSTRTAFCESTDRVTDLPLDRYHQGLLHSHDPLDRQLGGGSVLYWGHVTRNEQFARHKLRKFFDLNAVDGLSAKIAQCVAHCGARRWDAALGALNGISELQRLPFGSKIIAFADPENAGVYDTRINRFLLESDLGKLFLGSDGALACHSNGQMRDPKVAVAANQSRYQRWCLRLQQMRDELNAGAESYWTSADGVAHPWRAVDVERALFARAGEPSGDVPPGFLSLLRDFLAERPLDGTVALTTANPSELTRQHVQDALDRMMVDNHTTWTEPGTSPAPRRRRFTLADIDRNHRRIERDFASGTALDESLEDADKNKTDQD